MVSIIDNKAHQRTGEKHALEQSPAKPENCLTYSNKWFCINMYLQRKLHNHKKLKFSLLFTKAVFRYHKIYVLNLKTESHDKKTQTVIHLTCKFPALILTGELKSM